MNFKLKIMLALALFFTFSPLISNPSIVDAAVCNNSAKSIEKDNAKIEVVVNNMWYKNQTIIDTKSVGFLEYEDCIYAKSLNGEKLKGYLASNTDVEFDNDAITFELVESDLAISFARTSTNANFKASKKYALDKDASSIISTTKNNLEYQIVSNHQDDSVVPVVNVYYYYKPIESVGNKTPSTDPNSEMVEGPKNPIKDNNNQSNKHNNNKDKQTVVNKRKAKPKQAKKSSTTEDKKAVVKELKTTEDKVVNTNPFDQVVSASQGFKETKKKENKTKKNNSIDKDTILKANKPIIIDPLFGESSFISFGLATQVFVVTCSVVGIGLLVFVNRYYQR